MLERLHLQRLVAEGNLGADRARGRQRDHFPDREGALGQNVQHLAAHIAGGADDRDLETHGDVPFG